MIRLAQQAQVFTCKKLQSDPPGRFMNPHLHAGTDLVGRYEVKQNEREFFSSKIDKAQADRNRQGLRPIYNLMFLHDIICMAIYRSLAYAETERDIP
jgi:hypothetical protein